LPKFQWTLEPIDKTSSPGFNLFNEEFSPSISEAFLTANNLKGDSKTAAGFGITDITAAVAASVLVPNGPCACNISVIMCATW